MLRRIAQFILWDHLIATMWISGTIVIFAVLNLVGLVYPVLKVIFHLDIQTYQLVDAIIGLVGMVSFLVLFLSYALYRRRKVDYRSEDN